jgi:predicted tellurium resistance membrane protein TerC
LLAARWVLNVWPLQLAAALYLLWLCGRHLQGLWLGRHGDAAEASPSDVSAISNPDAPASRALASVVGTLAITDLAFSLDSVAAAVAVSDRLWLVMAGVIGVIALRLTAGLFIRWLEIYSHLETAGFLAGVGLVGVRTRLRLGMPERLPPEWVLLLAVAGLFFVWGFSEPPTRRCEPRWSRVESRPERQRPAARSA